MLFPKTASMSQNHVGHNQHVYMQIYRQAVDNNGGNALTHALEENRIIDQSAFDSATIGGCILPFTFLPACRYCSDTGKEQAISI